MKMLDQKLVATRRVSDRLMAVVLIFGEGVLWFICVYAPQNGGSLDEKQSFYDELKGEWDMHNVFMCLGDINGHVARHID